MNRKGRIFWTLSLRSALFLGALLTSWSSVPAQTVPAQTPVSSAQAVQSLGSVPAQLNVPGFARCLKAGFSDPWAPIDFRSLKTHHRLGSVDGLLLYLSVYPGVRPAGQAGWVLQQSAHHLWQTAFEPAEELLLEELLRAAWQAETASVCEPILTPGRVFEAALEACRQNPPFFRSGKAPDNDPLCAAVIAHNAFRTLGRHHRAVAQDPWSRKKVDLNPGWFQGQKAFWMNRIPWIQSALIPLRPDGAGDRYGEWYHFFGILAFGLRDYALHKDLTQTRVAARMNQVLNPILAGGAEEPEKARLDRDSAEVVAFLTATRLIPGSVDCDFDATRYVNSGDGARDSLSARRRE